MPTYTYEILDGDRKGHIIEVEQSIKDSPLSSVELDGQKFPVKRVIAGNTKFILKGGCWYRDGYERGVQSMPSKEDRSKLDKKL